MELRKDILSEINQISPAVANIGNTNLYQVPAGYFNDLPAQILYAIKEVDTLQKTDIPYQIPAGYFDGLSNSILSKIKLVNNKSNSVNEVAVELAVIAPLLNTINKANIFYVPGEYFENFSVNIVSEQPIPAKVINFANRTRKWVMYAAAAMLAGIIATGTIIFLNNSNKTIDLSYQKISQINVNTDISKLSDDEISNYLSASSPASSDLLNDNDSDDTLDIQDYLNNTSDDEIQQYLNQTADPGQKITKRI